LKNTVGNELAILNYHTGDPFAISEGSNRLSYYLVSGLPTAFFDGGNKVVGGSSGSYGKYLAAFNEQKAINSPCSLSINSSIYYPETKDGIIRAKIYSVNQIAEGNLKLRYAISESNISYNWGWLHELDYVLRDMVPDANGTSFSINKGEVYADSQSYTLSPSWNDTNCELVVFVQSDDNRKVLATASVSLSDIVPYLPGDPNGDGQTNLSDVIYIANYLLKGGNPPDPLNSGDPNGDCMINIGDVIYLANYLLKGGPAPEEGCVD